MERWINLGWEGISIKSKIYIFIGTTVTTVFLFALLGISVLRFSLFDFREIMRGNLMSGELTEALEWETKNFENYIKDNSPQKRIKLDESIKDLETCIEQLPFAYSEKWEEVYRLTWNIQNAYEVYAEHRDALLKQGDGMQNYIARLYEIYDMQKYLMRYVRLLNNEKMTVGNQIYFSTYPWIVGILVVIGATIFFSLAGLLKFARMLNRAIVYPLEELADASRKIAENTFFIEDIQVENQDEVGELVQSFNRMKNAMSEYAQAVEENRAAQEKIHEQEIERMEMESQLEKAKMKVLVSQMNPHFLFNTLNVIAGMANLEDADITEKMTRSLSTLLRYTIHNDLSLVPLKKELEVAEEYNYLQHMRFGARVRFEMDCQVDTERYEIPPFTFQPLIENAIIHGILPKIEGGKVRVKVCERGEYLVILVADNGVGMSKEKLAKLRNGLIESSEEHVGIAYRNILQRFKTIYAGCSIEIFSRENRGTLVKIKIPAKEAICIEY